MTGRRQIGSTMKPFVYVMALEDGYTPESLVLNAQRTYRVGGSSWTPRNANSARAGQMVPLIWGLSQSSNWATANLMSQVDPSGSRLKRLVQNFGVANPDIHPSMSLCLGPCEVTVGEMASAYTAFVNQGIRCAPTLVSPYRRQRRKCDRTVHTAHERGHFGAKQLPNDQYDARRCRSWHSTSSALPIWTEWPHCR